MLLLFLILSACLLSALGIVRPGYAGSLSLDIGGDGAADLGVKRGSFRETVASHDTTSTASTPNGAGIVHETCIQGKAKGRLNVSAQYSAGAAGDPPDFSGVRLYGDIPFVYEAGDSIEGVGQVEEYANSFDENGTIDYDLTLGTNGDFTRGTGS